MSVPVRTSSRVYSPAALERWFARIAGEWEACFSEEILERGREIYRTGLISAVELGDADAIVNCAFSRKDTCYAVIEWERQRPVVRCSTEDEDAGRAVAVAGLYEIEELVADEIGALPHVPSGDDVDAATPDDAAAGPAAAMQGDDARPARKLVPRLEGLSAGLRLLAYWEDASGHRTAAFGGGHGARILADEREAIVRLTGRAREAGFAWRREAGDFLLADPDRIAPFFSHARKRWEAAFGELEMDAEAGHMAEGLREVKMVGHAEAAGSGGMRVAWKLRLGRNWLDPESAERIARAGRGTHIVRGMGLVRIAEEQSEALAEWRVAAAGEGGEQTWPRYMVFSLFGERGAELDLGGELKAWRDGLQAMAESDGADEPALPEFLRHYQAQGVRWMANLRARSCHGLLADEMGLGKTLQVLSLLHAYPVPDRPGLIVCPASVVPVWRAEAARWYPDMRVEVLGSGFDFASQPDPGILWVSSYTQLRRHRHLLGDSSFGYAILDEAQQIKNPDAKVTHACCAIQAETRFALTGTPLENRLLDLWTLFRFLMPGLLGSRPRFEEAAAGGDAEQRALFERRLRRQIAPFILRRKKDTVGEELPPKQEIDLVCPITDLQRQVYEGLLAAGREELGEDLHQAMHDQAMSFFALLTRLRQACCDPGLLPGVKAGLEESGKAATLLSRLEGAFGGNGARKVVVFSQFVQLLKRLKPVLKREFPGVTLFELTGETRDRAKPVKEFQKSDGPALILVSLRAGGTGITLHAADYVFLLDPWWNPAVESQAVDRVHRIGQDKHVFVYRMITRGTIEERIQHLKREKRELFENTLGSLGTAADLREHFTDLEELARLLPAETSTEKRSTRNTGK